MTINGVDVSTYNAYQFSVDFGYHGIENDPEWIRSAPLPHFASSAFLDFKKFKVVLVVKGAGRDEIHANISRILSLFSVTATMKLDNLSHTFKAALTGYSVQERAQRRFHKLTLSFSGYEFGDEVAFQPSAAAKSFTLQNPGTAFFSPVRMEFTTTAAISALTISGLCMSPVKRADEPVIITGLKKSQTVVLDGANGLLTLDGGVLQAISIKCLPMAAPGTVTITSSASIKPTITILPIYM